MELKEFVALAIQEVQEGIALANRKSIVVPTNFNGLDKQNDQVKIAPPIDPVVKQAIEVLGTCASDFQYPCVFLDFELSVSESKGGKLDVSFPVIGLNGGVESGTLNKVRFKLPILLNPCKG